MTTVQSLLDQLRHLNRQRQRAGADPASSNLPWEESPRVEPELRTAPDGDAKLVGRAHSAGA
eukprot:CAMPEP_0177610814 /NCGR_PEP_ID=MMETSP0419_2-20121207/20038_1 /TAXON_ID=582737 /ORGANISM="Tetraselmis sp., Strain GSL018" /LENGTH=61 /DNA_ID=CAMNT_0019106261 /DNA_START=371 /DNA_END=553 /DNA_ORIENTATION=-